MHYSICEKNRYFLLSIKGTIDAHDSADMTRLNRQLMCSEKSVIIDLRHINHMHYRFAHRLEHMREQLKINGRDLKIICTDPYIIAIFSLVHYRFFYDITPDLLSAKHAISGKMFI